MYHVVLLSGWKRSGKDTAANHLVSYHGYTKLSFADALKEFVIDKYSLDKDSFSDNYKDEWLFNYPARDKGAFSAEIYKSLEKELKVNPYDEFDRNQYFTPRALAILEGNVARSVNPDFWVDRVISKMFTNKNRMVVISDWRFPNEYNKLSSMVGSDNIITIRINRFDSIDTNNESERSLDSFNFDYTITNTGSIDELHKQLNIILDDSEEVL